MSVHRKSFRIVVILVCASVFIGAFWKWAHARKNDGTEMTPAQRQAMFAVAREAERRELEALPQPFSRLLLSMHGHELQLGTDGIPHTLDPITGVTIPDGVYLYNLVRQTEPDRTAEVGFAEGFSTLYFLAALQSNGKGDHVALDPYELHWHGIGLQKVKEAGMEERFRFLPAKSIAALPELATEGKPYQIIFIDGDHRFDAAFTDFVLSDPICPKGGYILFHDTWMPSIKKVIAYIEHDRPDYARRSVPDGVNMAVFQKVGEDQRRSTSFVDF